MPNRRASASTSRGTGRREIPSRGLLTRLLPAEVLTARADTLRRAKLLVALCLAIGVWGPVFAVFHWTLGRPVLAAGNGLATLGVAALLAVFRRNGSLALAGNLAAADLACILTLDAAIQGGLAAPSTSWFPAVPVLAFLLAGRRSGVAWGAVMLGAVLALFAFGRLGALPAPPLDVGALQLVRLVAIGGSVAVFLSLAYLYE